MKSEKHHRPTTEEFVADMSKLYPQYDYSTTDYINNKTKVRVVCPNHGRFYITPTNHRNGYGCAQCGNKNKGSYHKKTTEQFITEAIAVHGGRYDYNESVYTNIHTKVLIFCKAHGAFMQTPASHIKSRCGCPECKREQCVGGYGRKRFDNNPDLKHQPGILYVVTLKSDDEVFVKIGITQQSLSKRFPSTHKFPYMITPIHEISGPMYSLWMKEQEMKKKFKQYRHRPIEKFSGHTECFESSKVEIILQELFK